MFGHVHRHSVDIDLLEAIPSDQVGRNLTRQHDHRDRVHVGVGDARDRIRRPRTGSDQGNPGAACDPGITVRGVYGGLLVPG
ncbi:hypothetical protein D3C76_1791590 [compost metagenome]